MAKGLEGNRVRTIICAGCGETVTRRARPDQRYCSLACYRSAPKPGRRTGEDRLCTQCGEEFYVPRGRVLKGEGDFCSLACHNAHQGRNRTDHRCKICDGAFTWSPSRTASGNYNVTYCSLACRDRDPERLAHLAAMQARQQLKRTNKVEMAGYALLDGLGVQYERQAPFKDKFIPDATIPLALLVVQFDGDYWHDRKGTSTEDRIRRRVNLDQSQDAYIRACGWQVVRLWESDLKSDMDGCTEKVRQHLRPPS